MATRELYATGEFRYGTRRLKAGDPVEMIGPHQRLYLHLGKVTEEKPKAAKVEEEAPAKAPRKRRAKKVA